MFGSVVSFDPATPAGSESVALGDDRIRSFKTAMSTAFADEHIFPASGGTAGLHQKGSARAFFGLQSTASASTTSAPAADGRMMIASDTSRLFGAGSEGTVLLGAGPRSLSVGSFTPVGFPQRLYVAAEIGTDYAASGRNVVTFPSAFSAAPFVFAQSADSNFAGAVYAVTVHNRTVSDFSYTIKDLAGIQSAGTICWWAVGHRAL